MYGFNCIGCSVSLGLLVISFKLNQVDVWHFFGLIFFFSLGLVFGS